MSELVSSQHALPASQSAPPATPSPTKAAPKKRAAATKSKTGGATETQKKTKKPAVAQSKKEKSPMNHPQYIEMASQAIQSMKEPHGSSRYAILKYIMSNFNVGSDPKVVNSRLKSALKRGIGAGVYKQLNGIGATGSFKMGDKKHGEAKKPRATPTKPARSPASKTKKVSPVKSRSPKKPVESKKAAPASAATKKKSAPQPKKSTVVAKPAAPKSPVKSVPPKPRQEKEASKVKKSPVKPNAVPKKPAKTAPKKMAPKKPQQKSVKA